MCTVNIICNIFQKAKHIPKHQRDSVSLIIVAFFFILNDYFKRHSESRQVLLLNHGRTCTFNQALRRKKLNMLFYYYCTCDEMMQPFLILQSHILGREKSITFLRKFPRVAPSNINAANWKSNDCGIERLRLLVDEHLLAEVGYCSLGYSNYPAQRARHA